MFNDFVGEGLFRRRRENVWRVFAKKCLLLHFYMLIFVSFRATFLANCVTLLASPHDVYKGSSFSATFLANCVTF